MSHIQDSRFAALGLHKHASASTGVKSYHARLGTASATNPVLVLLHGYPNSAYLWRHVVPLLGERPLWVPDLPGYGASRTPGEGRHDKVGVGMLVLDALREVLESLDEGKDGVANRHVVLVGHDRGARVAHHLHVSSPSGTVNGFIIRGLALLDIVPTVSQWGTGDSAARAVGWFHWTFLANSALAVRMIRAYGGGRWCGEMIERWAGTNSGGRAKMSEGRAAEVYASFFEDDGVIEASTRDYEAGATLDVEFEERAVAEGKRISVPLLLVYSAGFLPQRATKPIREVWSQPWSEGEHLITECAIGDGVGHFVPEEAPEQTAEGLRKWLATL